MSHALSGGASSARHSPWSWPAGAPEGNNGDGRFAASGLGPWAMFGSQGRSISSVSAAGRLTMATDDIGGAAMNEENVAVLVAKAALCEAGHPDLAALVRANRVGVPTIEKDEAHRLYRPVIAHAFVLGHQAAGHPASLGRGINSDFEWVDTVECPCPDWAADSAKTEGSDR